MIKILILITHYLGKQFNLLDVQTDDDGHHD